MKIGDTLTHGGRQYLVRGFDPEGVSPRMIYLEDAATGARTVVPIEQVSSPATHGHRRLRLVKKPKNPRDDRP